MSIDEPIIEKEAIRKRPDELTKSVVNRLRSVAGHVNGISRMVEDDAYCIDVIHQIQAVQSALNKISNEMNVVRDLGHILNVVVAQALRTTQASHGTVVLLDAESQQLELMAAQGFQSKEIEQIEMALLESPGTRKTRYGRCSAKSRHMLSLTPVEQRAPLVLLPIAVLWWQCLFCIREKP